MLNALPFGVPVTRVLPSAPPDRASPSDQGALFNDVASPLDGSTTRTAGQVAQEWSEEEIVFLHWRLLQELDHLQDPEAPLEEKIDTLNWVFTDPSRESHPFSFVSCLRVVGCSPLSPLAYFGLLDAEEIRAWIRLHAARWMRQTLDRYPGWIRFHMKRHPERIVRRLARNPQWINEQIRRRGEEDDFFFQADEEKSRVRSPRRSR